MQTALTIDSETKNLGLLFKKRYDHSSDVSLKIKGVLDTKTATANVHGSIYKFVRLGELSSYTPGQIYRPDTRLRLGIGARALSTTDDVMFSVSAKKKVSLNKSIDYVRGREIINSYTQLVAKGHYDYNVKTDKWSGQAIVGASHAIFRFSDDQDVRATAGLQVDLTNKGVTKAEPFLRVQENCWAVTYRFAADANKKNTWTVTYDL